ncbi:uncharacterized protein LOC141585805 [Silene latifolia]|uniref:uncharacterized protein LOC141585805 n=1 Tax=Silene latifolia TaxID=37657 RepID=UPI003D7854C1
MLPLSFVGLPIEMPKRRWRELVEALYESHFDPRKDEQLKQSKLDIENKLPKIIKLVRERRQKSKNRNAEANARKESELIELIEDFHKQYQFVYDLYDNLRDQLSETINSNKEEEGYFTATSSSDSESDSENDVNTADAHMKGGPHKKEFAKLTQEQESIHFDRMEKMKKVQENSKTVGKLEEKSRALQEQLKIREQELLRFAQMHKLRQEEASGLMKELELELSSFNIKLNAMSKEKRPMEVKMENKGLQARVDSLEKNAKKMDEDFCPLVNGEDTIEGGFLSEVSKIKELVVQVNQLKQNVDYLNMKKVDSIASTSHENLLDQVNKMKDDLGTLRKKNSDLEWRMKKKSRENSDLLSQIDSCKRELQSKAHMMQKEKEDAQVRLKNLESEVQNVSTQRNEVERQLLTKDQESVELKHELEKLQEKAIRLEKMLKEREDQLYALQKKFDSGEDDDKPIQMVSMISQINNLDHDLGSKNEFEKQLKMKNQEIIKLTSEREFLQRRVMELENKLQDRGDELSKLRNDMSTQIAALTRQVIQLQEETDMKKKLEDQTSCQEKEIRQLVDEKESLQAKILELEITLTEKEDEIASLQRRVQIGENEASARVYGLTSQINYFQEVLSAERKKSLEKLTHMENQNSELTSKLSNQQAILKQQEDSINKLHEDCKLVKGRFLQCMR